MSRVSRRWVAFLCASASMLYASLGYARFRSFHNETFDLALYTRMAWGGARFDFWDPIVNAHVHGIHLSPVLTPLGWLGMVFGTPEVLLVAQGVALGATLWPLATMAERRLGEGIGPAFAAGAFLLYPSVAHAASYEVHPGSIAILPLAWMIEGIDSRRRWVFVAGAIGVLLCREDLGLVTALLALLARRAPELRRHATKVVVGSVLWVLTFAFVLQPIHAPRVSSLDLHFGKWGGSMLGVVGGMISQPGLVIEHLTEPHRLLYLLLLLAPVALLPLAKPRWLLGAVPIVAINLLSEWPTTTALDSHYQTPLVPILVAAAIDGASVVKDRGRLGGRALTLGLCAAAAVCHLVYGGTPIAADFDWKAVRWDAQSTAAASVVAMIPSDASVQAPYALMPHLAEREWIARPPPPERNFDYVVLDAWHREQYAHREELLRTTEEPRVRDWLARPDHALVHAAPPYLVLRRGEAPRAGLGGRYVVGAGDPHRGLRLAACLRLLGAELAPEGLVLELVATSACPSDLAVRIGHGARPRRVDLLFDGLLSPAHLQAGDRLRSVHSASARERERWARDGIRIGLLRSSGARPEHADPVAVDMPL